MLKAQLSGSSIRISVDGNKYFGKGSILNKGKENWGYFSNTGLSGAIFQAPWPLFERLCLFLGHVIYKVLLFFT